MHRLVLIALFWSLLISCSQQPSGAGEPPGTPRQVVTAASVVAIRILPERPTPQSPLEAHVRFSGGQPEQVAYQWLRNGSPVPGAIGPTLGREHLRKGDFISLGVTIGRAGGEEVKSDAVVVGNTPPLLDWVEIKPGQPNSGDTLEAVVHGKDRDGDQLSYDHRWTVNGETVVGEHGASLEQRHFRRGDRVRLFVTPFDGTDSGREVGSPSVVIRDSPPKVISAPPEHLESTSYRYEVRAEDLDGDLLRFSLQGNVPPGMKIDEKTGVVDWQAVEPKEATTWEYEVVVQDPEGLKSVQKITLKYAPP